MAADTPFKPSASSALCGGHLQPLRAPDPVLPEASPSTPREALAKDHLRSSVTKPRKQFIPGMRFLLLVAGPDILRRVHRLPESHWVRAKMARGHLRKTADRKSNLSPVPRCASYWDPLAKPGCHGSVNFPLREPRAGRQRPAPRPAPFSSLKRSLWIWGNSRAPVLLTRLSRGHFPGSPSATHLKCLLRKIGHIF